MALFASVGGTLLRCSRPGASPADRAQEAQTLSDSPPQLFDPAPAVEEAPPIDIAPPRIDPPPPPPPAPEPALPDLTTPLVRVMRAYGMLFLEGLSLGLGLWSLRVTDKLPPYVGGNELTPRGRTFLLGNMAGAALFGCLVATVILIWGWRKKRGAAAVDLVHRVAWRGAPLIVSGLVTPLLHWRLWIDRELTFLAMATVVVLGLQGLTRVALSTPPVFSPTIGERLGRLRLMLRLEPTRARIRRALPWVIVFGGMAAYATFFAVTTVRAHRALYTNSLDLGLEENLIWNALHFARPFLKSSPFGGPTSSHFGYHFTPIAFLIALPYALYQHAETLLILQAVMMALGALPLFLFARRHVGNPAAALIAVAYLCYPPLHGSGLYDFHYLPLGPFFLWMTLYALDARRNIMAAIFVVLTLSVREDVAAGLAIVGGLLLLTGLRPRAGLLVGAIGAAYFVLIKLIIMPHALKGSAAFVYMFQGLLPSGESSFGGVLKTVFGNPVFTMTSLLERDKLVYLLQILTPLAFFPLRRPIGLLCCVPGFFFTLLSTGYAPLIQTSFQYTANWTSYLFLACVVNLVWVTRTPDPAAPSTRPRRVAWMVAIATGIILTTSQYGAFVQQEYVRGGFGYYHFKVTPTDAVRRKAVYELIKLVPPRAKIVASENLVPQVSNRPDAYTLRMGLFDADYLLFEAPRGGEEGTFIRSAFNNENFGVVAFKDPFVLAKRGYPRTLNESLRYRIGY
jgi:uncharacterized membrane protein